MKQFKNALFAIALIVIPTLGHAQQQQISIPSLPQDSAVRKGVLPNGMTYYVRHNALPENQAFFYIVQKVGSVQEEESQRGLAHFLEHMAFNGSENFPDSMITNYCERIGVKFGENLNAYTSTDETVYNINNVPVTPSNIDSCLLILHDWSHYLTLEGKEIDKERGVIHEEWRMRRSAMQRILERNLETLYPGSRYGRRMPIGLMEIVDKCPYDTLRAYYQKWYHPNLQGIIVAGDIDVDQVEEQIKKVFSPIPNPENQAKYENYPVPDNKEPIYVIDKDKEQQQNIILMFSKRDPMPMQFRNTPIYIAQKWASTMACTALNNRLSEIAQKPSCPFLMAQVDDDRFLISKTKDAFQIVVVPKPGKDLEAVKTVMSEIERAKKFGFNESELIRVDEEIMSRAESRYNNRNKQYTPFYIQQYIQNFLHGTPMQSIAQNYQSMKELSTSIKANKVLKPMTDQVLKQLFPGVEKNFVVLAIYPEKEGVTLPKSDAMRKAVEEGISAEVKPYVDNVKNEPLLSQLPKAGKIKKVKKAPFGYKQWTLSNGVVVYSKYTDFNDNSLQFYGYSWGGTQKYNFNDPKIRVNAQLIDLVNQFGGSKVSDT